MNKLLNQGLITQQDDSKYIASISELHIQPNQKINKKIYNEYKQTEIEFT